MLHRRRTSFPRSSTSRRDSVGRNAADALARHFRRLELKAEFDECNFKSINNRRKYPFEIPATITLKTAQLIMRLQNQMSQKNTMSMCTLDGSRNLPNRNYISSLRKIPRYHLNNLTIRKSRCVSCERCKPHD